MNIFKVFSPFSEPLTIPIWALIALSTFVISIVVFVLSHSSPYEGSRPPKTPSNSPEGTTEEGERGGEEDDEGDHAEDVNFFLTYFNCVYWALGCLTQQGKINKKLISYKFFIFNNFYKSEILTMKIRPHPGKNSRSVPRF